MYGAIHKSLRDFRLLWYSTRDGHAEGEHVNRGRDTPSNCPTLQVLNMSTLGDAADVNPVIKFLPHTVNHVAYGAVVYVPPMPSDLPQLRWRIVEAVAAVDRQMLQCCFCTAEVGNPGGNYELPCIVSVSIASTKQLHSWLHHEMETVPFAHLH
jgi:hypothetical protein